MRYELWDMRYSYIFNLLLIIMKYGKVILKWLPYIYFIVFFLLIISESASYYNLVPLVLSALLLLQMYFQLKYVDWFTGMLLLLLSLWFLLAYASDFSKITSYTNRTWEFIVVGGLIVISNFTMSVLMIRNAIIRVVQDENNVERI